ncbi:STAS domain-containing protein [Streptomyces roseolilacinus]|uniref:STAS domain-containing protein n=1 Tax=Streptomyces roseolilacinus TaxID=66904 RepID=UPI00382FBEDE
MTTLPDESFRLTVATSGGELRIALTGDLDYDTADALMRTAREHLAVRPAPGVLHLDCERLVFCDSMGLATLLMIHRVCTGTGTAFHLHNCPGFLEQLLRQTGTLDYLACPDHAAEQDAEMHPRPPQQP